MSVLRASTLALVLCASSVGLGAASCLELNRGDGGIGGYACEQSHIARKKVDQLRTTLVYLRQNDKPELVVSARDALKEKWDDDYKKFDFITVFTTRMSNSLDEMAEHYLTGEKEECVSGPKFGKGPDGKEQMITDPCAKKAKVRKPLPGNSETHQLATRFFKLGNSTQVVFGPALFPVERSTWDSVHRGKLDDAIAEIDGIIEDGKRLFKMLGCDEKEAFASSKTPDSFKIEDDGSSVKKVAPSDEELKPGKKNPGAKKPIEASG